MKRIIIQTKIILQGSKEPFFEYENRLNLIMKNLQTEDNREYGDKAFAIPSADHSGRMCCVINYQTEVDIKRKTTKKLK